MDPMTTRAAFVSLLTCLPLASFAQVPSGKMVFGVYSEAVYNRLTGTSTAIIGRYGYRYGQHEIHGFFRNETFDSRWPPPPALCASRGGVAGVGYRYYFGPQDKAFFTASAGAGILGENVGKPDYRIGLVFGDFWEKGKAVGDLYAEAFWVSRADDALATVRVRPGTILHRDENGRLWAYGVGQMWASQKRKSGTENRVEVGAGLGYVYKGMLSFNLEFRGGYQFAGEPSSRAYTTPWITISGGF